MSVAVDLDHLANWWAHGPTDRQRWLLLETIDLEQAKDAVLQADALDPDSDDGPIGGAVAPFGDGAAVEVLYCEDPLMVRRWLTDLVAALETAGWSGHLVADERAWDGPADGSQAPSTPTAFFAWRLHDPPLALEDWRAHWGVDTDLTATVMRRVVLRCLEIGGEAALAMDHGPSWPVDLERSVDEITEQLISAIDQARHVALTVTSTETGTGARMGFGMGGISMLQLTGHADPETIVRELRDELLAVASDLRWGAIRLATAGHLFVSSMSGKVDLPGDLGAAQVARAGKLLNDWVPDANGIQVLNEAHLTKLRLDEQRWVITPLEQDRFSVQARDPQPWFSGENVASAVLSEARRDFERAQLTSDALYEARLREPLI